MTQNLLYIFSHAPYSHAQGQETLDAALIGASFEQEISVLFVHDGVFQLKKGQQLNGADLRHYTKTFKALNDFGIERIYIHQPSLMARGLSEHDLMVNVTVLTNEQIGQLLAQQTRVFHLS